MTDALLTRPSTLVVRNMEKGMTCFTDRVANIAIRWDGKDDPKGGDYQMVPAGLLDNMQFQMMVFRGVFEVLDPNDASAMERIKSAAMNWRTARLREDEAIHQYIDRVSETAIATLKMAEDGTIIEQTSAERAPQQADVPPPPDVPLPNLAARPGEAGAVDVTVAPQ